MSTETRYIQAGIKKTKIAWLTEILTVMPDPAPDPLTVSNLQEIANKTNEVFSTMTADGDDIKTIFNGELATFYDALRTALDDTRADIQAEFDALMNTPD